MSEFEKVNELLAKKEAINQKKTAAIEVLVKYGLIIPTSELTLYHGRVSEPEKVGEWSVNPNYTNANNDSGHSNLNSVNALSTSPDYNIAANYAMVEKMRHSGKKPEVYEIVADSNDSFIINNFDFNMNNFSINEQKEIYDALSVLGNYGVIQLAPVDFEFRNYAKYVLDELYLVFKDKNGDYLSEEDVSSTFEKVKQTFPDADKKVVSDLAGSLNAKVMLLIKPSKTIEHFAVRKEWDDRTKPEDKTRIEVVDHNGKSVVCPINLEYIAAWLANNNIIGISENMGFNNCLLFDLERINTKKAQGEKLQQIISEFGEISLMLENFSTDEDLNRFLRQTSPLEIIAVMESNPEIKNLLDAPAGVWEGFSIGEHTETTLRVYEESFERTLPKELAPFIKMAMVCHDIGKGVAESRETMHSETQKRAKPILNYFGVSKEIQELLLFAIDEAQVYTSAYFIKQNISAEKMLKERCAEVIYEAFGKEPTEAEIDGLTSICKVIQNCDSGAYTRYGVTRDRKRRVFHKNGNDMFTKSFHKPTDLKKANQHMIDPKEHEQ